MILSSNDSENLITVGFSLGLHELYASLDLAEEAEIQFSKARDILYEMARNAAENNFGKCTGVGDLLPVFLSKYYPDYIWMWTEVKFLSIDKQVIFQENHAQTEQQPAASTPVDPAPAEQVPHTVHTNSVGETVTAQPAMAIA